jgi:hypothetical protein
MHMEGWNHYNPNEYSAELRAQQRALRKAVPHQPPYVDRIQRFAPDVDRQRATHEFDEAAWVLIFNEGRHNEGVYTHTQQDERTSVLAFESNDDAAHFAQILVTKGFGLATPLRWSAGRLSAFCQAAGWQVVTMPPGDLPPPPLELRREPVDELGGPSKAHGRERMHLGSSTARRDHQTIRYRLWLDKLLSLDPVNCNDDDCSTSRFLSEE